MRRNALAGNRPRSRESERGQLLVVFALAMIALIGAVGLIIDGGDTFLQRRSQQNATDAAAMAAGFAYLNFQNETDAARTVATRNGFTHGSNGVTVNVTVGTSDIVVTIAKPHQNYFSGVVGFASWDVSTTASVVAGTPNGAQGLLPLIFNEAAFNNANNRNSSSPASFGEPPSGSEDVPQDDATFNWTVYCTGGGSGGCNADSTTVEGMITGGGEKTTVYLDDTIAPLNAGAHT